MIGSQMREMSGYLRGIELLKAQGKRAVIPIVGKALSVLFWTVTVEDMKLIKRKLTDVERDRDRLLR